MFAFADRLRPPAVRPLTASVLSFILTGLLVLGPGARFGASARAASIVPTLGPINTAVIVANFTDSPTLDITKLKGVFAGNPGADVTSYFSEASYGKSSIVPSFYGAYLLPMDSATACSNTNTATQDLLNAVNPYITFANFQRLVYEWNTSLNCQTGSAASSGVVAIGTPQGTITAGQDYLVGPAIYDLQTTIHELSHNLGNLHGAFFSCYPAAFIPPTNLDPGCVSASYMDGFDVLGALPLGEIAHLSPHHKAQAGWFDPGNNPTVTTSGTYTILPYETPTSGVLALNIPRSNSGTAFTVEYRQPLGFDSWMGTSVCPSCTVTQGASIRLSYTSYTGPGGGNDDQLIDTTPGSLATPTYLPSTWVSERVYEQFDGALRARPSPTRSTASRSRSCRPRRRASLSR